MARYPALHIGPLPVDLVNRALGVDLDAGDVWVSKACHRHIAEDHPRDYPAIIAALCEMVTRPLYVGQDPKHPESFYLVRPISAEDNASFGLAAIAFEPNMFGGYNVVSAYSLKQDDIDRRRAARRLHVAI